MKEKKVQKPRAGEVKRFRDARGVVLTLKLQERAFNDHRITSRTVNGKGKDAVKKKGQPERFIKREAAQVRFAALTAQAIAKKWMLIESRARFDYEGIPDTSDTTPAAPAAVIGKKPGRGEPTFEFGAVTGA